MIRFLLISVCVVLWVCGAQAQSGYPALYDVTGVSGDDVLNIRARPSADADIIGEYGPHQTGIEVTGADETGRWLRVNTHEQTGWVAARFMQPEPPGDYAFARALNCFGTEPFWSLDVVQGMQSTLSLPDRPAQTFGAGLATRGEGRNDRFVLGFGDGLIVLTRQSCGDGMSDRTYALDASMIYVNQGLRLYSGCCSINPD